MRLGRKKTPRLKILPEKSKKPISLEHLTLTGFKYHYGTLNLRGA
jgi:hypothetical protein